MMLITNNWLYIFPTNDYEELTNELVTETMNWSIENSIYDTYISDNLFVTRTNMGDGEVEVVQISLLDFEIGEDDFNSLVSRLRNICYKYDVSSQVENPTMKEHFFKQYIR